MAKSERGQAFLELAEEIAADLVEISKKVDCLIALQKPSRSSPHSD